MTRWLSHLGKLRRERNPDPDLLLELFVVSASEFKCPDCERLGLKLSLVEQVDDEAWGMARTCELCGIPIPAERLEIFPETTTCKDCKRGEEQGMFDEELPFCPKCGAFMKTQTTGAGITRYVYRCPECGYK